MAEIGLKNKQHRKIFEQILIVDNFIIFKKLMIKRNKELELEALKEMDKQDNEKDGDKKGNKGDNVEKNPEKNADDK